MYGPTKQIWQRSKEISNLCVCIMVPRKQPDKMKPYNSLFLTLGSPVGSQNPPRETTHIFSPFLVTGRKYADHYSGLAQWVSSTKSWQDVKIPIIYISKLDLFLEFISFCQIEQFLLHAETFHMKFHITLLNWQPNLATQN